jgi:hypothetical protein
LHFGVLRLDGGGDGGVNGGVVGFGHLALLLLMEIISTLERKKVE